MTTVNKPWITGIGSLPHHNIDSALDFSFKHDLPYLPQIPIRNPWEYMIAQALEGLPGLQVQADGQVALDLDVWSGRYQSFRERLNAAFRATEDRFAFEGFEPSAATSSSWQPFLWELEERKTSVAKIQIAGPLTCQWALRTSEGLPADRLPDLSTQVFTLILARALAMARRIRETGAKPILYLDEPGIYAYSPTEIKHQLAFQELKILVQALQRDDVQVGLHCCSNTHWGKVLSLGIDILSIDTELSFDSLLTYSAELKYFLSRGGVLSLGIVSLENTQRASVQLNQNITKLTEMIDDPILARSVVSRLILTPTCGLALHTPQEAEWLLAKLLEAQGQLRQP